MVELTNGIIKSTITVKVNEQKWELPEGMEVQVLVAHCGVFHAAIYAPEIAPNAFYVNRSSLLVGEEADSVFGRYLND